MADRPPWQIEMFDRSLKKKMRLRALSRHLGLVRDDENCLLITCGDNNGAMNYHLRALGGKWQFADLENDCLPEMRELLDQDVLLVDADKLPFPENFFDRVITIDVHEHLDDPLPFGIEVGRVVRSGGQVICTVPNGDESKLAVRLKSLVGMTPREYGHSRVGLTTAELAEIMRQGSVELSATSGFSKFFTELLELTINFAYVKVLAKRGEAGARQGQIAPTTSSQLESVRKTYRLYSIVYPVYWLISRFDALLPFDDGYVIVLEGRKLNPRSAAP